jgi:hypothetical protein
MADDPCTGDYGCLAERHIGGCFATDVSTFGRQTRLAVLLAVARDHARLTTENTELREVLGTALEFAEHRSGCLFPFGVGRCTCLFGQVLARSAALAASVEAPTDDAEDVSFTPPTDRRATGDA